MPSPDLNRLMWAEACEMLDRAERLHRSFYRPASPMRTATWEPPVDVYEVDDGWWLVVAMPGADGQTLEVSLADGALVVRAERRIASMARGGRLHRLEIPFGRFERRLELPAGTYRLHEREWRDGCLYLGVRLA